MTDPLVVEALESVASVIHSMDTLDKLRTEQLRLIWQDIDALRDEVHTLALALVRAGVPLVDPPPVRSVS